MLMPGIDLALPNEQLYHQVLRRERTWCVFLTEAISINSYNILEASSLKAYSPFMHAQLMTLTWLSSSNSFKKIKYVYRDRATISGLHAIAWAGKEMRSFRSSLMYFSAATHVISSVLVVFHFLHVAANLSTVQDYEKDIHMCCVCMCACMHI